MFKEDCGGSIRYLYRQRPRRRYRSVVNQLLMSQWYLVLKPASEMQSRFCLLHTISYLTMHALNIYALRLLLSSTPWDFFLCFSSAAGGQDPMEWASCYRTHQEASFGIAQNLDVLYNNPIPGQSNDHLHPTSWPV